jgi:hypothetical protein
LSEEKEVARGASDVGASDRWLLVGFVLALLAAIAIAAMVYRPKPADPICSNTEDRCGNHSDPAAQ